MKKTVFLLTGICLMLCALHGCQEKPLGVLHRSSYTDGDYYHRTRPYFEYDSIVFTDGSTAVWKTAHAPMNNEIIVRNKDHRKIAVISCGSEVSPIFKLPRYDDEGRLSELLTFVHEVYETCPFNASWYDHETDKFDLVALRNSIRYWTIDRLPEDAAPVLYKFEYDKEGMLTCVSSSDGEKIEAPSAHYLEADLVYEPGFWVSDLSGSSHELYITQKPRSQSADAFVMAKYIDMTMMYEIIHQDRQMKRIRVFGPNSESEYKCLETIDITYDTDCHIYTHEYAFTAQVVQEYWKRGHKVRMDKYDEAGTLTESYHYEYPDDGIVVMHSEKQNTSLNRMVKQVPQKLKVWDDLYEDTRTDGMGYAERIYYSYKW